MRIMSLFTFIGICTVILMVIILIVGIISILNGVIKAIHKKYIQKHRFDKPPIAKCYCIDCVCHSEDGYCGKFDGWCTADNWFCWDANPKK